MRQISEWLELYRLRQFSISHGDIADEKKDLRRYIGSWVQWTSLKEGLVIDQLEPGWIIVDCSGQYLTVAINSLLTVDYKMEGR